MRVRVLQHLSASIGRFVDTPMAITLDEYDIPPNITRPGISEATIITASVAVALILYIAARLNVNGIRGSADGPDDSSPGLTQRQSQDLWITKKEL